MNGSSSGTGDDGGTGDDAGDDGASPCPTPCAPGLLCCGGACVNTDNDPSNCGGCGVQCSDPTPYCSGSCQATPCGAHVCIGAQQTCCGDRCCNGGEICCKSETSLGGTVCFKPSNDQPTCPLK